ncbi:hypothetical protein C0J52_06919 [Blattella germanica]|nr:hypothetical protein C0J52_06919 [Blattella germanica]
MLVLLPYFCLISVVILTEFLLTLSVNGHSHILFSYFFHFPTIIFSFIIIIIFFFL